MNGIGKTNEYKLRGNDPSALLWEINSNDLLFPDLQSGVPKKPLRKKTALRGVFDLAGKTKTRRMSWLEYDYNRVWLTENEKQCSWLIKQGQVFFFWLNFVLFRFLTLT